MSGIGSEVDFKIGIEVVETSSATLAESETAVAGSGPDVGADADAGADADTGADTGAGAGTGGAADEGEVVSAGAAPGALAGANTGAGASIAGIGTGTPVWPSVGISNGFVAEDRVPKRQQTKEICDLFVCKGVRKQARALRECAYVRVVCTFAV